MGWSDKAAMRCKKHPLHKQTPGVCSYCLRERLTKLQYSTANTRMEEGSSSSCSSSLSSSPYSSGATSSDDSSPIHERFSYMEGRGSRGMLFLKSRSVVAVGPRRRRCRRRDVVVEADMDGKKKKVGFWSKLIRSTGKRTKKMMLHSSTVKEISSSHHKIY